MLRVFLVIAYLVFVCSQHINLEQNPQLPQVPLQLSTEFQFCEGRSIVKECYRAHLEFDGVKKRRYTERTENMKTRWGIHTGRRIFFFDKRERICQEQMYQPLPQYWRRIPTDKAVYNGTTLVGRQECHMWFWKEKEDDIHRWYYKVSNTTEAVQWRRETGTGMFRLIAQYDFLFFKPREPSFHYFFPPTYCPITQQEQVQVK